MQTRANTKAVNHWFLMLFIVLIFLYFIGCVLGLGTKSCKSKDLWLFFLFPTDFTDYTDIFFDTKNLNLCKSVRSVGLFSLSPPSRWRHSSYFTMVLLHNHFDSIYNINA